MTKAATLWPSFNRIADRDSGRLALVRGEVSVTFGELRDEALCYSAALLSAGLNAGDRCLLWSANGDELAAAMLGAWRLGAVVVLVNDEAPLAHLRHAVAVTTPLIVVTDEAGSRKIEAILPCPILVLGSALPFPDETPAWDVGEHDPASVFFTSGSTGMPKGVTQSHHTLVTSCEGVASFLGLTTDDIILCPIPWSFDYGYGQLLSTILLGVTQVIPTARSSLAICEAIEARRPTIFAGLPSIFALMLRGVSTIRTIDVSSIRLVTSTGGPIPPLIYGELRAVFRRSAMSLNYGMTETYRSAGLPFDLADAFPTSVGRAYPGVTLAVIREDGSEAEAGEIGELIHKGNGVFMRYWGEPEASAIVLRTDPLWDGAGRPDTVVFTGDLASRDQQGLLTIHGRRDRLIKSMGVRVSPDEVETLLRGSSLVVDAVVLGLEHDVLGQMVCAAVVPRPGVTDAVQQLKVFARQAMSNHMQPRHYLVIDELPLTPNGKTDLASIRRLLRNALPQPAVESGASR